VNYAVFVVRSFEIGKVKSGVNVMIQEIDNETAERLLVVARDAAATAYAPYSQFPVGAAALLADGSVVSGCNVENASFGLTVCAERTAVFTAVAAGHREIVAIAVTAPRVASVTPCGACRQVLNEFKPVDRDLVVILEGDTGPDLVPLGQLLPRAFGPRDLDT
jgi:cytidine deaminase